MNPMLDRAWRSQPGGSGVGASANKTEAASRSARMLRTALGPAIAVEVMLNPDGRLWVDRLADGLADTGERLAATDGERIVRLVAHHVGAEVHAGAPRVSAELPDTGERFEGLIPPLVTAPAFAIRKPAVAVFSLDDYATAGIMTAEQAATLRDAVGERRNILVAGGTSTGKTFNAGRRTSSRSGPRTTSPRFPTWCVHRFGSAPTASPSGKCAAKRRSTC